MNRRYVECFLIVFLPLLLILPVQGRAQSEPAASAKDGLYTAIAAQDKRLFDAYNTCDLKTLSAMVSEDLEFYHDKTGLAVGMERIGFITPGRRTMVFWARQSSSRSGAIPVACGR